MILSVIVPAYNMEAYLPRCLGSFALERFSAGTVEIVVVDDGSRDATAAIAHDWESRFPGVVRVVSKPNGHYGSAVNAGLAVATGRYVKVVDADDAVEPGAFGSYLGFLRSLGENGPELVVNDWTSTRLAPDGSETTLDRCSFPFPAGCISDVERLPAGPLTGLALYALAYRLSMLRAIAYRQSEGIPYTDTEWALKPMRAVRSLAYFHRPVVRYTMGRPGQSMEPERFARDFPIVVGLIESVLEEVGDAAGEPALFQRKLVEDIGHVYYRYLIAPHVLGAPVPAGDLEEFDRRLSAFSRLYAATAEVTTSRRLRFRFVAEWRRRKSSRTLRFFIWRAYLAVAKLLWRPSRIFAKSHKNRACFVQ